MYHRFGTTTGARRFGVETFEQQVRYLKQHFDVSRLDAVAAQLRNGGLTQSSVALTIDDGYYDFLEFAYPVLKRHGVPATVFVISRFADQAMWLWFDAVHYLIYAAKPGRYAVEVEGRALAFELGRMEERESAWNTVADACAAASKAGRVEAMRGLQESLDHQLPDTPTELYRSMTWDELRSLDEELIEVGAHTCTHAVLSRSSPEDLEFEVSGSKAAIERELGRPVRSFCYPRGRRIDYNDQVVAAVRRAGYECAVVAHGSLVRAGADPLRLERMGAPADLDSFYNLANGASHLYEQMIRRFQPAAAI